MKQPILRVSDIKVMKFSKPAEITTVQWVESLEDGDRFIERAVSNREQFDQVMAEYLKALEEAYRP